jgi:uncharacterized membrane protein YqaE (UPF0057 family)
MKKIAFRIVVLSIAIISSTSPASSSVVIEPVSTSTAPGDREVNNALNELKTLSRKEKKSRIKEVKKLLKQYRTDKKTGKAAADDNTILLAILAILLPPLAIYLKEQTLTWKFWVSLALIAIPIIFGAWYLWLLAVGLALLVVFDVL